MKIEKYKLYLQKTQYFNNFPSFADNENSYTVEGGGGIRQGDLLFRALLFVSHFFS